MAQTFNWTDHKKVIFRSPNRQWLLCCSRYVLLLDRHETTITCRDLAILKKRFHLLNDGIGQNIKHYRWRRRVVSSKLLYNSVLDLQRSTKIPSIPQLREKRLWPPVGNTCLGVAGHQVGLLYETGYSLHASFRGRVRRQMNPGFPTWFYGTMMELAVVSAVEFVWFTVLLQHHVYCLYSKVDPESALMGGESETILWVCLCNLDYGVFP